jgi:hypothetical protein
MSIFPGHKHNYKTYVVKKKNNTDAVARDCNLSYSEGRVWENQSSRPAQAKGL